MWNSRPFLSMGKAEIKLSLLVRMFDCFRDSYPRHVTKCISRQQGRSGVFPQGSGRKTEKSRLKRSIKKTTDKIREIRHWTIKEQVDKINHIFRGHYNYYGMGGNLKSMYRIYQR